MLENLLSIAANLPCRLARVGAVDWSRQALQLRQTGARLLALWGADDRDRDGCFRIYAAFLETSGALIMEHPVEAGESPAYPSLATIYPGALRMERAVYDLLGVRSRQPDHRGWLRHGGWPEDVFPLRRDFDASRQFEVQSAPYPFVRVEGEGVHEIPVGPVHAGIIEPGHFRFSIVGEGLLRLEERLGYQHKGVEKRFESLSLQEGRRLAARICGDSAVAFSWAYCAALEAMTGTACPERAVQLRALALEHERMANHLGDIGAIANDAGFAFGLTHFMRLKEDLLRATQSVFGARYLMDYVVPGGVASDTEPSAAMLLLDLYERLEKETASLRELYENHAGLQDRFHETGYLTTRQALELDALGLAARASGVAHDLRADHPCAPYDRLEVKTASRTEGDVAARVAVRYEELFESFRLARALWANLAAGETRVALMPAAEGARGMGLIEGWRGPVLAALEAGAQQSIRRCHMHDPSWQNWPLLEYAVIGNIVPDFPLINKSFNLSYSGQDG